MLAQDFWTDPFRPFAAVSGRLLIDFSDVFVEAFKDWKAQHA